MAAYFDTQPILVGPTLKLRPMRRDDFEALFEAASDPLIWEQHPQSTRYQREVFQTYFIGGLKSNGGLVVMDKVSGKIIGASRYYDYKPEKRQITIGYTFLTRKYWGGVTNRELKDLMLRHAFQFVDHVLFEIGETNTRSRRAIEKIGGKLLGAEELDGKAHVVYRIEKAGNQPEGPGGDDAKSS